MARRSVVETGRQGSGDVPPRLALGMPGALAGLSTRGMGLRGRRLKGTTSRGKAAASQRPEPAPAALADEDLDTVLDLRDEELAPTDRDMAQDMAHHTPEADGLDAESADGDEADLAVPVDVAVDVDVEDDGDVAVDDLPVEALPGEVDLAVDGSLPPALVAAGTSRPVDANVDSLIAELEAGQRSAGRAATRGSARRQLEELAERKRVARELEDFEDFEI